LHRAEEIAFKKKISDEELFLLRIACLYHDSGFLFTYKGHEEKSCELVRAELIQFGLGMPDIDTVCGMIMATQLPQTPKNKLEEIICDADLDYLGRYDFFPIAQNLFLEMKAYGLVNNENEWNEIQENFLETHHYFTEINQKARESKKQEHLTVIKQLRGSSAAQ
jgi:predicted metal-dependent HD superfamily phosphohydrolase